MPEQKPPSERKIIDIYVRVAILIVLGFLIYALLCHGVSSGQKQRLTELGARVEALHQNASANHTVSSNAATSASLARAAAQTRCDQLAREIFGEFKIVSKDNDANKKLADKLLPKARELASLYDRHVRVSENVKIDLCTNDRFSLMGYLVGGLTKESGYVKIVLKRDMNSPGTPKAVAEDGSTEDITPDQVVNALIPAAKFLRVMGMPEHTDPVADALQFMFDPDPKDANAKNSPITATLQALDLNLISPQEPWMWQKQIPYHVQIALTEANDLAQRLSTFQGTYDYVGAGPNEFTHYFNVLKYMPFRQRDVERRLEKAEDLASRADKITTYQDLFTPGLSNQGGGNVGINSQGQARARLACAAIEMLRGNPAPSEAGPASNFYDIYTGGRVQIQKTPIQNGNVRVKLITNCSAPGKNYAWGATDFSFVVPANHPCLNGLK